MNVGHADRRDPTPKPASSSPRGAAWVLLIGMGATSVTYNVFHAVAHHLLNPGLALLYGLAPVTAAALLSHIVAEHDGGKWMQAITYLVMLGGMTLSIGATAAVVGPAAGPWMRWQFGAVVDAAALLALRVILESRSRRNAAALALDEARSEAAAAAVQVAVLRAELDATRAELEAARTAVQGSGPASRPGPVRRTARTAAADDLALEAKALKLLATDMNMSGAELARRLGVSPGYGRKLRRRLCAPDRPVDRSGRQSGDRSGMRSGDGAPRDRIASSAETGQVPVSGPEAR